MTELRCTHCGAFNIGNGQNCKVCNFELNPATQLPPGSLVFAGPHTKTSSYGSNYTTVDSISPLKGVSDILGPTIKLFIENFWLITKLVVVIVTPFEIFRLLNFREISLDGQLEIGTFFLDLFCQVLIAPALIYSLMQVMQTGTAPSVNEAYRWGTGKIGKLTLCAIVSGLVQFLGYILCIVPGIIASVVLMLVYPLAVLEKSSVSEVILDSKDLTKGHRWNIFGAALVIWMMVGFFSLPAQAFAESLMWSENAFWPLVLITSILSDIVMQSTTILSLVTYLSIRALSSQPTQ
ncbi:MAG TPA: hypothetical protein VFR78_15040 [Pyrinomonadaceae bacterium]|nr:hypothetical protein [Pyrinomonadaceae bacterium]